MDKTFDDLFNEFFKEEPKKDEPKVTPNIENKNLPNEIKRILDNIGGIENTDSIDEYIEKEIDANLGEPDKIEHFTDNGVFYEKKIWHTPSGDFVKVIFKDSPFGTVQSIKEAPVGHSLIEVLEAELEKALKNEQYEKAAELRDNISKIKKTI